MKPLINNFKILHELNLFLHGLLTIFLNTHTLVPLGTIDIEYKIKHNQYRNSIQQHEQHLWGESFHLV